MEIHEAIEKVGLNQKETRVYLALLELGSASAYSIAPKAQLKRPITYIVLENLIQKGLVSKELKNKKTLYVAGSPAKLMADVRKKEELLTRFMPNLEALYNVRKEKPQVQMFEGIEGIKEVYEKIFKSENVLLFGTSQEISRIAPNLWSDFLKNAAKNKMKVRDLVMQSEADKKYVNKINTDSSYLNFYQVKYLPKEINMPVDSAIFGDSVAFFSFRPNIFSVVISSRDISALMRAWHNIAWANHQNN